VLRSGANVTVEPLELVTSGRRRSTGDLPGLGGEFDELGEIIGEESVLAVIAGCAGVKPAVVVVREKRLRKPSANGLVPLTTTGWSPCASATGLAVAPGFR
jgi:hypothetical protein